MGSIGGMSVPILGSSCQYTAWTVKIKCILEVEEVDDVVYGITKAPETIPKTGGQVEDNFRKKDAKARMILTCGVDSKHTKMIETCKTARAIWDRLKDEYADSNPVTVDALLTEYHSCKMDSGKSVSEYISHIESLVGKLDNAGKQQEEASVLAKIVSGLPEEYGPMVRAWKMTPAQFKTKQLLIANLKDEEKTIRGSMGEAKIARTTGKRNKNVKGRSNRDKNNDKCHCCNATGHWWINCPDRSPDWRPPKSSSKKNRQAKDKDDHKSSSVEKACMATYDNVNKDDSSTWYLDSGASSHMTCHFHWLDNYTPYGEGRPIRVGNGELVYARGTGSVSVVAQVKDRQFNVRFRNVQYVPDISDNLISIGAADEAGWDVRFGSGKVAMILEEQVIIVGPKIRANLYKLDVSAPMRANIHRSVRTLEDWHKSLGHPSVQVVQSMAKSSCVSGMSIDDKSRNIEGCGECQEGRATRSSHPDSTRERASKILERVHMDLVGPINPTSIDGSRFFLLMKDEYSSFLFVECIPTKTHVFPAVKSFVNNVAIKTQARVLSFRTDQGSEFTSNAMKSLCVQEGIVIEMSSVYTPEQNGEAERANRSVIEMARTNLSASGLGLDVWSEAVKYAVYTRNRIPCARSGNIKPFEKFYGRKPDLSHLVQFGQPAHALNTSRNLTKFDARTIEVFIVGYGSRVNTYRCLKRESNEILITSDVVPANHRPKTASVSHDNGSFIIVGASSASEVETAEGDHSQGNVCTEETNTNDDHPDVRDNLDIQQEDEERQTTPPPPPPPRVISTPRMPEFRSTSSGNRCPQDKQTSDKAQQDHQIGQSKQQTEQFDAVRPTVGTPGTPQASRRISQPLILHRPAIHYPQLSGLSSRSDDRNRPSTNAQSGTSNVQRRVVFDSAPTQQVQTNTQTAEQSPVATATARRSLSPRSVAATLSNLVSRPKRNVNSTYMRYNAAIVVDYEPTSYADAINGPDSAEWRKAIKAELDAHSKNKTWMIVPRRTDCKEISSRWIFKIKHDGPGGATRYKARLVARGYTQEEGVDFNEIFSPVVRMESIRLLFSLAVQFDLKYVQFDITTAFLNGVVEEELYLSPPEGLDISDKHTCRLIKSLYGLRQAPRAWNSALKEVLEQYNMKATYSDPCVYVATEPEVIYLAVYVDDGLVFSKSQKAIDKFLAFMKQKFEVKQLDAKCFLGLQIEHNQSDGSILLHQTDYSKRVLMRYNMADAKEVATPLELNHKLHDPELLKQDAVDSKPYAEILGSLMYCATATRPDISYAVSVLSKFTSEPRPEHWKALKRVLRYIKGTYDRGLMYRKCDKMDVTCYTDADWAGDRGNRRSMSGMAIFITTAPVCYRAQQQPLVALSTTEAEYIAAAMCGQDLLWIRRFLGELNIKVNKYTLMCDNQSSLKLIRNPEFHQRTKHIDTRYHFIRERYAEGCFELEYVSTTEQLADIFTKSLTFEKHANLRSKLGCIPLLDS